MEKEIKRLEGQHKRQEDANEELAKTKQEAIAAETAGLEKAKELQEQLAQAKRKLDDAKSEQAEQLQVPKPPGDTSPQALLPREGDNEKDFAQRRLGITKTSLPPIQPPM